MEPQLVWVDVGASLKLNCSFSGHPVTSVTWIRNGVEIDNVEVVKNQTHHVLMLPNVRVEHFGVYQCQIFDGNSRFASDLSEVQLAGI